MNNGTPAPAVGQERFTFAQIPLVMAKDPILKRPDIAATMFILPWVGETGWGWTTVNRISCGACMCERSVLYSLKRLEKAGWFYVETSTINSTRRDFLALWMTDEGFEKLSLRLGVTNRSDHSPSLIYTLPNASVGMQTRAAPFKLDVASNSGFYLQAHDLPVFSEIASMDACKKPSGMTKLERDARIRSLARLFRELSRDFAAIERGLPCLLYKGVAKKVREGSIEALMRIVVRLLKDHHSKRWHRLRLQEIADGALETQVYMDALTETLAMPPEECEDPQKNGSRGAMFCAVLDGKRNRRTDEEFQDEWDSQRGLGIYSTSGAATS